MNARLSSGTGALCVALLVGGAIFVPGVSANENNLEGIYPSEGDPVDKNVVLERSPHLFDDAGNRLSDKEISQKIEEMSEISHIDGMDENRSKELSERFRQFHKYRSIANSTDNSDCSPD